MIRTTRKLSSQLEAGDIVWTHGMAVRLGEISTGPGAYGPVFWSAGTVLNLEHVLEAGNVPASFLWDGTWTVQGNDNARWEVELPAGLCAEHEQHATCPACGACDFEDPCTTTEREEALRGL